MASLGTGIRFWLSLGNVLGGGRGAWESVFGFRFSPGKLLGRGRGAWEAVFGFRFSLGKVLGGGRGSWAPFRLVFGFPCEGMEVERHERRGLNQHYQKTGMARAGGVE